MTRETERAIELLKRARVYVKKGWTRHTAARDEHGHPVDPHGSTAVKWCAYGAFHKAIGPGRAVFCRSGRRYANSLLNLAAGRLDPWAGSYVEFNERQTRGKRGQERVVELFDTAIGIAKRLK